MWGPAQLLQPPAVRQEWTMRFRGEEQQQGASDGEGAAEPFAPRELRILNRWAGEQNLTERRTRLFWLAGAGASADFHHDGRSANGFLF
jgi:hypothetical protein